MARSLLLAFLVLFVSQSGCIWKLWTNDTPMEERVYDVYGTVQSISLDELIIQANDQELIFRMRPSSIKGGDLEPGTYVHVYYQMREDVKEVTMVVEKIG